VLAEDVKLACRTVAQIGKNKFLTLDKSMVKTKEFPTDYEAREAIYKKLLGDRFEKTQTHRKK